MHNASVSTRPETFSRDTTRRVIRIQALTLVWMSIEAVVSLGAAWFARSPSLLGFGGDSAVEFLSAAVVLWRFRSPSRGDHAEHRAARIAGGLLFLLAGFVVFGSVLALLGHVEARPSPVGITESTCRLPSEGRGTVGSSLFYPAIIHAQNAHLHTTQLMAWFKMSQ
jgi:hypothetical protein